MCNCEVCTVLKLYLFLFSHLVCVFNALCVPVFVRTTYMQLFLLLSDLKAVLLMRTYTNFTVTVPWSRIPASQWFALLILARVLTYTLFLHSLMLLNLPVGLKGSIFCAALLWRLVSHWVYWLLCSEVIQADSPMLVSLARVDYFEFSDWEGYACEF